VPRKNWPSFPEELPFETNLTLDPPSPEEQFSADWPTVRGQDVPKTSEDIPKLDDTGLRKFVVEYLRGEIFTSVNIRPHDRLAMTQMIFLPLVFGGLELITPTGLHKIGVIYAYMKDALPRSINGYPIFGTCGFLHTDDWGRAWLAITREQDREKTIEV